MGARETAGNLVGRMIALGARRTDRVVVLGRGQIETLIELAARGFLEAASVAAGSPAAGERVADIIVVPTIADEAALLDALPRLCRGLTAGGTILFANAGPRLSPTRRHLRSAVAALGLVVWRGSDDSALCCRTHPVPSAKAA